jgi:hypothetical protein
VLVRQDRSFIVCHSSEICESQRRHRYDQRIFYDTSVHSRVNSSGIALIDCQTSHEHSPIPICLLQVCRQIYHEAAFKPYTQATFDFDMQSFGNWRPGSFLAQLVPSQARAIARIRLITTHGGLLNQAAGSRSQGLKHVEIHFQGQRTGYDSRGIPVDKPLERLTAYKHNGGTKWLMNLGLKSIHFSILIDGAKSPGYDEVSILKWMKCEEDAILAVASKPKE